MSRIGYMSNLWYKKLHADLAEARYIRAKKKLELLQKTPHSFEQTEIQKQITQIALERYQDELQEFCLAI